MKLVTKMRKFVERMEGVESMSERQLVKMLFRAEKIMAEYIETEERKERAYIALKEATNYRTRKTSKVAEETKEEVEEIVEEVAATIQFSCSQEEQEILDNGGYIEMNEEILSRLNMPGVNNNTVNIAQELLNQGRLVITKESDEKGLVIGAYHKDGAVTYFTSSSYFDYPVVFGSPALTAEIRDRIMDQKPGFYQPVTKNFKSIAMFGQSNGKNAMVYLADAKRLVFEGYIGNMVFSTTKDYIDKGYSPLVTRADIFIENGGKHNHVTDNMCTPSLKKLIAALIEQYMTSPKFAKASNDVEYFNRLRTAKRQQMQQERVVIEPKPQPVVQNYGYGIDDIYAAMQQAPVVVNGGGVEYDPEF